MTKLLLVTLALVVAGLAHAQDAASQGDMGVQLKSATDSLAAAEYEVSRLNQALGQEKSRVLGSDVERHLNRTTISLLERDHAQAQVDLLEKRKNFKAVGQDTKISYVEMPEALRERYQYFTEASLLRLRRAGYAGKFKSVGGY